MPVDYSKWDALELSDDSDIEVHPNVDKRSFIRAKQNQIHQQREQRKHELATLKYEHILNAGLAKRLTDLLAALKNYAKDATSSDAPAQRAAELAFRAVMESGPKDPADDKLPPRPEGVHEGQGDGYPTTYSKMLATVLDLANKALDERKVEPEKRFQSMIDEIGVHLKQVNDLQAKSAIRVRELEEEDARKITSENYHTGFDSSYVNKSAGSSKEKGAAATATTTTPELLNPQAVAAGGTAEKAAKSGGDDDDDADIEASPEAKKFAQIPVGDYRASLAFITAHPSIVAEKETDGLLVEAFNAGLEGDDKFSLQCVHQALLLQYCRALGKDGVSMFFKRISSKGQAHDMFFKDVTDTHAKIRSRTREIKREREAEAAGGAGVEQIQLHAVEPGTVINITIPEENSESEEVRAQRAVYDGFKPEVKKALETGSLDELNKVLGAMGVDEAEELVGLLGEAGCLSLEEEIIDTTTEEGKKRLEDMERERAEGAPSTEAEPYPDPE
ncbi:related to Hsp90 co-chaperone Cdc37 [Cephalotrichum gorgonifer]|uniref:Hsp90 chaperone protein kinase-targeting subunit n=1 Tax=Cephalotrichum gorgonifer TaxID=2041049 RepID=A0AAE8MVL9_9PEZI|nr:related to Hsp90 co-chaperone Cdc37 [Cephalotrichum gorgonifer]